MFTELKRRSVRKGREMECKDEYYKDKHMERDSYSLPEKETRLSIYMGELVIKRLIELINR